jgi:ADP-ribose pyrophosphatase YjhB (NUDIX family)
MGRKYPARPILGVGVVVIDNGNVVLVQRAREPARGEWSIPGGRVRRGESAHDAALREVREETGLVVELSGVVEVLERIFRDDDGTVSYHYLLIDYLAVPKTGKLNAMSDAADAAYFSFTEILDMSMPKITVDVIKKALDIHGSSST